MYEEEIDLRPYIQALIEKWYWIVGTAVVAAVIAFGITSLAKPTYEATALVTVISPTNVVLESLTVENLDPRFRTVYDSNPLAGAYPDLAKSDELLAVLLTSIAPDLPDIEGITTLREMLDAEATRGVSLLRLTVRYHDAEKAALVANTWAELFVPWANEVFGTRGQQKILFFEAQLAEAQAVLETAESELIQFQSQNRASLLGNLLASYNQAQVDYLAAQRQLEFLTQDAQSLRSQLASQSGANITLADQLTALDLQLRAFNAETGAPLQLQIDSASSLTGTSRQAQLAFLDDLLTTLGRRTDQLETRLEELEPLILELQWQKEQIETEANRLTRNRNAAHEAYTGLTRRVTEERLSIQDLGDGVRLASKAAVPEEPASSIRLLSTVLAFTVVLVLSSFVVLTTKWWQEANGILSQPVSTRQSKTD